MSIDPSGVSFQLCQRIVDPANIVQIFNALTDDDPFRRPAAAEQLCDQFRFRDLAFSDNHVVECLCYHIRQCACVMTARNEYGFRNAPFTDHLYKFAGSLIVRSKCREKVNAAYVVVLLQYIYTIQRQIDIHRSTLAVPLYIGCAIKEPHIRLQLVILQHGDRCFDK